MQYNISWLFNFEMTERKEYIKIFVKDQSFWFSPDLSKPSAIREIFYSRLSTQVHYEEEYVMAEKNSEELVGVEKRKNCLFLTGNYLLTCNANNVYIPSQFEIEEYCKDKRHTFCPFFKFKDQFKKERTGSNIPKS